LSCTYLAHHELESVLIIIFIIIIHEECGVDCQRHQQLIHHHVLQHTRQSYTSNLLTTMLTWHAILECRPECSFPQGTSHSLH